MPATQPNLGYGDRSEVNIDTYNQWQRQQPWYQSLLKSFGQDPNNVHLNDSQKQAVIRAAQANGVVVDEGGNGQEVDDSGNFRPKGHALRNTLIVAGLAGAALATGGAAGLFGGAAGIGGEGAGAAAGLGGVESGAAAGLGAAALPGAGTALGGAAGLGGVEAGAAAGLGAAALPGAGSALGGAGSWDAAGNFIGPSTVGSTGTGSSILGTAKGLAGAAPSILGTIGAVGSTLGAAGKGAADARVAEAGINQKQDALALQRYTDSLQGANTDLAQKRFQLTAPAQRESNAVRGDILSNAKDFSYGAPTMVGNIPVPTSTGGLRPSILSADTRNLGATIAKQSNQAQQSGDVFNPLPQVPNLTPLPQPGAANTILNTAGSVGNLSDLLSKLPYGQLTSLFGNS